MKYTKPATETLRSITIYLQIRELIHKMKKCMPRVKSQNFDRQLHADQHEAVLREY